MYFKAILKEIHINLEKKSSKIWIL